MRSTLVVLALAILNTGCGSGSDTSQGVSTPATTADTTPSTSPAPATTKPSETTSAQSANTQSTTPVQPSAPPTYKPHDSTSAPTAFVAKVEAICRRRDQQLAANMKEANANAGGDVHAAEQLFLQPEQTRVHALEALQPPAYARVRYDRFTSALQTRLGMLGELMPAASNDPKAMRVAQSVERLSEQAASAATSLGINCSS